MTNSSLTCMEVVSKLACNVLSSRYTVISAVCGQKQKCFVGVINMYIYWKYLLFISCWEENMTTCCSAGFLFTCFHCLLGSVILCLLHCVV